MVDWTKPIEAVHRDGRVIDVLLDTPATFGCTNPDCDGDWWTTNPVRGGMHVRQCWKSDGSPEGSDDENHGWRIRNRAEPANDELAELRAFKEAAIARFPELAEPETDEAAALRFEREWQVEFRGSVYEAIAASIAWARANPR